MKKALEDFLNVLLPKIETDEEERIIRYNDSPVFGSTISKGYAIIKGSLKGYKIEKM